MIKEKNVVAAFDFDGTITYCDTFIPFLLFVTGKVEFAKRLILLIPKYLAYKFGRTSNQAAKEAFITAFLKGFEYARLRSIAEVFSTSVLQRLCRRQIIQRISWHKSQGHGCVLVSASLDVYLTAWARSHGIDEVISSQLEIDTDGIVTGKLKGENCYGAEKALRLKEWLLARNIDYLYAYGDSRGDVEMLQMADTSWFKGKPLEN